MTLLYLEFAINPYLITATFLNELNELNELN